MKTGTKYFGEIEYEEGETINFPSGLFGFEEEKTFLLMPFPTEGESTLFCLQSTKTAGLAFTALDPFMLDASYAPVLQGEELGALEVTRSEDLYYYVLCAVKNPVSESTVNMKCPIAINGETRVAYQVILEEGPYTMRHPLSGFARSKEEGTC